MSRFLYCLQSYRPLEEMFAMEAQIQAFTKEMPNTILNGKAIFRKLFLILKISIL